MQQILFKNTAVGVMQYDVVVSSTNRESIIVCTYGIYNKNKTTISEKVDNKKLSKKVESIIISLRKKGYKTLEELNLAPSKLNYKEIELLLGNYQTDIDNFYKPNKCKPYESDKFDHPIAQPKINGNRCTISWGIIPDGLFSMEGVIMKSHEGDIIHISHIENIFTRIFGNCSKNIVFDGEIYKHDEFVTTISGACRNKYNAIHKNLQFHCFDLSIPDLDQIERLKLKHKSLNVIDERMFKQTSIQDINYISDERNKIFVVDVCDSYIESPEEAIKYADKCIDFGYEGAVIRKAKSEYQFGKRTYDLMKIKKAKYGKFKVLDVIPFGYENTENNVGKGVTFILQNDLNNLTFTSNLEGNAKFKYNIYLNKDKYIGTLANIKYRERTKNGLPFHTNVIFDNND